MSKEIKSYMDYPMVKIPGGEIELRDSWAEEARGCGASCRRRSHPSFCIDDLGFRLARSF